MTIENNGPAPAQDTASALFGMDGVEVTEALWPYQLAYEWAATVKAVVFQRAC